MQYSKWRGCLKHMSVSALAFGMSLALVACGGGGSADGSGGVTLTGLAATGAGIANGTVTARCASGPVLTGSTDSSGVFTLSLGADRTLPCMLQVSGGTPNVTLFSFAQASGRVNITPATDLVVTRALGADPSAQFASFNATTGSTIDSNLTAAKTYVNNQLSAITGSSFSTDLMTGAFAVGDADDKVLDTLAAAMQNAEASPSSLRAAAASNSDLTDSVDPYLAPPANVVATANSASQITVSWSAVPGATSYKVYRASTTGNVDTAGDAIGTSTTTTYVDAGLSASTAYFYKTVAVNAVVAGSQASNEATATTNASSGGNTGGNTGGSSGLTCNTALFQQGAAVRSPTTTELASFAQTYTGSEGDFGPNPGDAFVASGSATLVFTANGTTTYNGNALSISSYCLETLSGNAGTQLVINAADDSHFDLKTSGAWTGFTGAGKVVNDTTYTPPVNTSLAGVNWTQLTPATSFNACNSSFNAIAYTTNQWVAVGDSGCVRTSSDGVTWSAGSQPYTGFSLTDVIHANGRYVAVGTNGLSQTSTDGVTWTKSTAIAAATRFNAVVWTGSKYLAVGAVSVAPNYGFNVYTSTDGLNWTAGKTSTDPNANANFLYLSGVAVNGSTLVAVGGSTTNCVAWRSTDGGSTWSSVGSATCGQTSGTHDGGFQLGSGIGEDAAKSVAYGNGRFVAVGALGSWATSTTGTTWTTGQIDASSFPNVRINKVYFDGAQFIALGNQKRIYTSTDGQTWVRRNADTALAVSLVKGNFYGITGTSSGRLVVVGNMSSGGSGFMTSTP